MDNTVCVLDSMHQTRTKILQTKTSYARGQTNLHPMENDAVVVPALGQRRHIVTGARCMTIVELDNKRPNAGLELDVRVRLLSSGLVGSGHCVCLSTSDIQYSVDAFVG